MFGEAMYLSEDGHVQSAALNEYCEASQAAAFLEKYGEAIPAKAQDGLKRFVAAKLAYTANRKDGDALTVGLAEARAAFLTAV